MKLGKNMRTVEVYRQPTFEAQAVKVGLCWPAFFFGVIWMLIFRLWGLAVLTQRSNCDRARASVGS